MKDLTHKTPKGKWFIPILHMMKDWGSERWRNVAKVTNPGGRTAKQLYLTSKPINSSRSNDKIRVLQTLTHHANRSYCHHDLSISCFYHCPQRHLLSEGSSTHQQGPDFSKSLGSWTDVQPLLGLFRSDLTAWVCSRTDYHFIGTDSLFGSDACSPFYNLYKVQEMVLGHEILPSGGQPRDMAS